MTKDMTENEDPECLTPCVMCPKNLPEEELGPHCWQCQMLSVAGKNRQWEFSLLVNDFKKFWGPDADQDIYPFQIKIEIKHRKTKPTKLVIDPTVGFKRGTMALFASLKSPEPVTEDQE